MSRFRLLRVSAAAVTLLVGGGTAVATPAPPPTAPTVTSVEVVAPATPGHCPDDDGVTVIVDFQELSTADPLVACAPGPQETGLDALENAGFEVTGTDRWGKSFICRINGLPTPDTEDCVDTPPAHAYWSYWHAPNGGDWEYSSHGATFRTPPPGSFEGWSFALDRDFDDNPPPRLDPVRPVVVEEPTEPTPTPPTATGTPVPEHTAASDVAGALDAPPPNPHRGQAVAAGRWLAEELVDGRMPGFVGADWGLTIDALLALAATNADPAAVEEAADAVAANIRSYNSHDDWGVPGVRVAGATAKILVAAVAADRDPTDFGGHDMRRETLDLIAGPDAGVQEGRLKDQGTADQSNTFGQSLGVIGLARSGGVPQSAVDFLIRQQCSSGGFRLSPELFGTPSASCDSSPDAVLDPDSTAMAVQALLAADEAGAEHAGAAAARGAGWLASVQRDDGSFGGSGPTAGSNTNSSGLAGQALAAAGLRDAADEAADYVAELQLTEGNAGAASADRGAIAYNPGSFASAVADGVTDMARDQWRRATAQAVLALAKVPLGESGKEEPGPPPPSTSQPTTPSAPETSHTPPPGSSPAPTSSEPVTSQPTGTAPPPVDPAGVDPKSPPPLARTGADVGVAVALLGALLLGGAALLWMSRRRIGSS
ncbi:LPXTG cell wall anchor domain-containing protein [Actinoalloteichus caeruleus]|uniref:LPXTG-motif cell wall anchor domain-containing protein n=1 Tax=Actinoalloteichus caeruleus DSM 43889 TaxID=1120930 RepID=A0ABT1JPV7_ACTCY|nr:prenyltransferase/squalene oxidase repeat-containing protein [Actinoalloteichus caeruleus]MCP2334568.1 LPXTG-motif cell wall anchor domain-containing protein [Actinoalloteichus caeruleus DSM 43889]